MILGGHDGPGQARISCPELPELDVGLASLFAEHETEGAPVRSVSLRLARRADARWAAPALRWLHTHGRRVIVRTAVVMPRPLTDAIRRCDAAVQLELGHHRLELQRALVGPEADGAAALLLQSQYLQQLGVCVGAHLGPVFPAIHERGLAPLLAHTVAAGLRDVHVCPGVLTSARLTALTPRLDRAAVYHLRRVFGLGTSGVAHGGPWRLRPLTRRALVEHVSRLVRAHGLAIDRCGCPMLCHRDRGERPGLVTFAPRELFATSAAG